MLYNGKLFEGENFHEFCTLRAICKSFSLWNFGHATPTYTIGLEFREVFSVKCSLATMCIDPQKFSPSKVSCYTVLANATVCSILRTCTCVCTSMQILTIYYSCAVYSQSSLLVEEEHSSPKVMHLCQHQGMVQVIDGLYTVVGEGNHDRRKTLLNPQIQWQYGSRYRVITQLITLLHHMTQW